MSVTEKQLDILHHTLGLTPEHRTPYRNHYVAGDGHYAMPELTELEAMGLMVRRAAPAFCDPDDILFLVTDAGRTLALDLLPPPPKYSRYEEYLRSEVCESFAEWLGIEVPKRDYHPSHWSSDPKYGWVRLRSSRATGEYGKTLKDAKASYKAALAARRPRHATAEVA
jgi:hypothetical protein